MIGLPHDWPAVAGHCGIQALYIFANKGAGIQAQKKPSLHFGAWSFGADLQKNVPMCRFAKTKVQKTKAPVGQFPTVCEHM
jgi:hypothetical protein